VLRHLYPDEVSLCLEGGRLFLEEAGFHGKFKPSHFEPHMRELVQSGHGTIIGSFGSLGIEGALAAVTYQELFTGDKVATELWWFMLPQHRRGSGAIRMIREYEKWAKTAGCVRANMVHLESLQPERLSKLYQSLGYTPLERGYSKSLNC